MTEITGMPKVRKGNTPKGTRHLIDPVAFSVALVGGPVVLGLLGAPTIIAPIAVIFGGPLYLLLGLPIMLIRLSTRRSAPSDWAALALLTHLCLFTPLFLYQQLSHERIHEMLIIYLIFGAFFAPFWGWISGKIYSCLQRDFFKQTI